MTMSLGTALSIMGLSLAVRYARERTVAGLVAARPGLDNADGQNCRRVVLILFATVLFLTVIPVSAGGDYIAAGC